MERGKIQKSESAFLVSQLKINNVPITAQQDKANIFTTTFVLATCYCDKHTEAQVHNTIKAINMLEGDLWANPVTLGRIKKIIAN